MNKPDRLSIYYRSNVGPAIPGKGAWAFVVYKNDSRFYHECNFIEGLVTPIQAQYFAILPALDWLYKMKAYKDHIRFYGDNMFVVNQINGVWPPSKDNTVQQNSAVQVHAKRFLDIGFTWVSKQQMAEVEKMAWEKLREIGVAHGGAVK